MNKNLPAITLAGRGVSRTIHCPVMQSPLAGVSDQVFRGLVRRWAPDALLFTEMINASCLELEHGRSKIKNLSQESGPVGVQLFDHRPQAMVDAARRAEQSGAFLIDINMGCPVKKVARKGGGSGLLKDPDLAEKIVIAVTNAVQIPVTVKMRLGWSAQSSDPVGFALRMQSAGAQLITLHGRTREQGFSGTADWDAVYQVKEALSIPVIANGDVNSTENAIKCLKKTGADGIMIGRGSLGSPWLVGQINAALKGLKVIKTPNHHERIKLILEQLQSLLQIKGDHGLLIARKHMNWSCKGFPRASQLRESLVTAKTPAKAIMILEDELKLLNQ